MNRTKLFDCQNVFSLTETTFAYMNMPSDIGNSYGQRMHGLVFLKQIRQNRFVDLFFTFNSFYRDCAYTVVTKLLLVN